MAALKKEGETVRMISFRTDEVREFDLVGDLHQGDVFEAGNEVFLVTMSGDFSLRVIDMFGRSRSIDECEWYVMKKHVVPVMMRRLGVRLCRS